MNAVILLVVMFLSGGGVVSKAAVAPSLDDCRSTAATIGSTVIGQKISADNVNEDTIIDAQASCFTYYQQRGA